MDEREKHTNQQQGAITSSGRSSCAQPRWNQRPAQMNQQKSDARLRGMDMLGFVLGFNHFAAIGAAARILENGIGAILTPHS
jgi:hypothetical protein